MSAVVQGDQSFEEELESERGGVGWRREGGVKKSEVVLGDELVVKPSGQPSSGGLNTSSLRGRKVAIGKKRP